MKLPCFIFAVDHRPIMAKAAAERGLGIEPVAAFKALAVDAVAAAIRERPSLGGQMAILLDDLYGSDAIAKARAQKIPCGQPIEQGGVTPFAFARPDWQTAIVAQKPAFLKVRLDGVAGDGQEVPLGAISRACEAAGVPLVPEPLCAEGPARVADWITFLRAAGVKARWWKIEGSADLRVTEQLAAACGPGEGLLLLGKSAPKETLARWFSAARQVSRFEGFAVGRSIFWQPFEQFLAGAGADATLRTLCDRYLEVIDLWQNAGPLRATQGGSR